MKFLKAFTFIAFILSLGSIISGFVIETDYSEKLIGFGVLGLFVVVFPLFSFYRWKGKKLSDYMLTKENIDKMRENQREKNS